MNARKPKLFIGSSTEALDYANAIQENLEGDAECTVWPQAVFDLSRTTFSELQKNLTLHDSAVFVFSPDDKLLIRNKKKLAVRDNVLFELGLFCGRLGAERVFVAAPSDIENTHFPSDLLGVTFATYRAKRSDDNITAALGSACSKIRRQLRTLALGSNQVPPVPQCGFFSEHVNVFPFLFQRARRIVLYFIHSRRWRENHHDQLVEFLRRPRNRLTVFLPNSNNKILIKAIQAHFEDGPAIPGLITDARFSFRMLQKQFPKKVTIRSFNTYPTYSFYKFDDQFVVAAYPTTPRKRDVPTFRFGASHPYGKFVSEDLAELSKKPGYRRSVHT